MGLNRKCGALWLDQMTGWSAGIGSVNTNGTWLALFTCSTAYLDNYWNNLNALASMELQCNNSTKSATFAPAYSRVCIGQVNGIHYMNQCYEPSRSSTYAIETTNRNVIYFEENYNYSSATQTSWPAVQAFGLFDNSNYGSSTVTPMLIAWGSVHDGNGNPVVVPPEYVPLFRKSFLSIAFNDASTTTN